MTSSSIVVLVLLLLLCSLSSSSAQSVLNVTVGSQYTAVQTAGVPPLLAQTVPQPILFTPYNFSVYYDNPDAIPPTAQIKSDDLSNTPSRPLRTPLASAPHLSSPCQPACTAVVLGGSLLICRLLPVCCLCASFQSDFPLLLLRRAVHDCLHRQ